MTPFAHKQLWESIADQLRDEILDGRLPAGHTPGRDGAGRPVRRLARTHPGCARRPVPQRPGRSTCRAGARSSSSLTERDLEEVYVIRRAIEEAAVPFAIAQAD